MILYKSSCRRIYTYGANIIISMYMVHIYICTQTSIHTKWVDKCVTPMAGEDRLGQTFVEPLGVHPVVPRLCVYMLAYTNRCIYIYICR